MNVDLDVFATFPLRSLARAMDAAGAFTLHCGRWREGGFRASFELAGQTRNADATIRRLARIVRHLPQAPRRLWDRASRRAFSIGVQAGSAPHAFELVVAQRTLRAIVDLEADLSVTIYSPESGAS